MNKLVILSLVLAPFLLVSSFAALGADSPMTLPLWPNGAPDEKGTIGPEHDSSTNGSRTVAGGSVIRLANVTTPTLTLYRPSKRKANGAAVVICPGGAYAILAMDLEGTEIAHWFNSLGVTAAVLKYRVPKRTGDDAHLLPLEDAQRALGLMRSNARAWSLDPHRIGVMGFSAGGHLTAHLLANFDKRGYAPVDEADAASCRPDFALLIYPAYLGNKEKKTQVAPELNVNNTLPPVFITQTADDVLGIEGTLAYYLALKNAKVPAEMHIYATGGHGYGLRPSRDAVSSWPKRAAEWLGAQGMLEKK